MNPQGRQERSTQPSTEGVCCHWHCHLGMFSGSCSVLAIPLET